MKCLVCKTQMLVRMGKHGPFYYCPNGNHGTISVEKYGRIIKTFTGGQYGPFVQDVDPLITEVERQSTALGGILSDIDRMMVDTEDPEYFEGYWQNIRDY